MKRNEYLTNIVYGIHGIYAKASEPAPPPPFCKDRHNIDIQNGG